MYVAHRFGSESRCFEKRTFKQAALLCAASGGRMCTREEMQMSCTKGTGCNLENRHIWSAERSCICDMGGANCPVGKHWVDCGNRDICKRSAHYHPPTCIDDTLEFAGVRCCSKEMKRGFEFRSRCNLYVKDKFGPSNMCHQKRTFQQAFDICQEAGARLCTKKELDNECTRGMGCDLDRNYIWTSEHTCGADVIPEILPTVDALILEFDREDLAMEAMELGREEIAGEPRNEALARDVQMRAAKLKADARS